jgi:hypothetical protein
VKDYEIVIFIELALFAVWFVVWVGCMVWVFLKKENNGSGT